MRSLCGQSPEAGRSDVFVKWVESRTRFQQGAVDLKVKVETLRKDGAAVWIAAEEDAPSFDVFVFSVDGKPLNTLLPARPRGFLRRQRAALSPSHPMTLSGDFAINLVPGSYSLVAQLLDNPAAKSSPLPITVEKGRLFEPRK